jgi:hypothetical protein
VVFTINYNTVPDFHTKTLHASLLSLFSLVFTIRFLATDSNTLSSASSHSIYSNERKSSNRTLCLLTAAKFPLHFTWHITLTSNLELAENWLPNMTRVTICNLRTNPHRKLRLYSWNVFTESLHSNGRGADSSEFIVPLPVAQQRAISTCTSIVACVFRGFCDSTVPAWGKYATVCPSDL